jgi:hypothetical protein
MHTYNFCDLDEIVNILDNSILDLIKNDNYLLKTTSGELAINHRLAIYLERNLPERLKNYNVDCEYYRDVQNKSNRKQNNLTPDIIIHKRGNNYPTNYLYIEAKRFKSNNDDVNKIISFLKEHYFFRFGCFLKYFTEQEFIIYELLYIENESVEKIIRRVKWS